MKMIRSLYEWTMEKAAHRHAVWWLAMFSFIEASFFPIPPHPLLGLMCLAEPKKALRFAGVATVASVVGGLLGYAIGWGLYDLVGDWLIAALGMQESFPRAICFLQQEPAAVFSLFVAKGVTPIPFKLLTITAGFVHLPLWLFLSASLISRSISFMIVGLLFRLFGAPIKSFIDKYLGLVTLGFVALVIAGFAALALLDGGDEAAAADPCATVQTA
jgi:membrane protein YqaA with SNARE-associated domain